MPEAVQLGLQMLNMLGDSAGVREIVRSDLRDLHERGLRSRDKRAG